MINKSVLQKEFVSEVEKLKPVTELDLPPTPAFSNYKALFPEEAKAHPAKMNTKLLEYLIAKYTKEGDTVLDPMAGSGSTAIVSSLLNRNSIAVELEEKFVKWIEQAKENVQGIRTLTPKGRIIVKQGDARKLSEALNNSADSIITSPPYTNSAAENLKNISKYRKGGKFAEERLADEVDTIITSPPYEGTLQGGRGIVTREQAHKDSTVLSGATRSPVRYSNNKQNIGNLNKDTYLEAMFQVYCEMFKVLRNGGKAAIVVKPFIRNKKVVDLPYQTWLLLEKVGFRLVDVLKLRLKQMSFWRINYYHKHPEVPMLVHEYIIVVEKQESEK